MTDLADRPEQWPVVESEPIWSGDAPFSVRRDVLTAPGGSSERFGRLVVEHPGATIVLAVDEHDRALVLSQYRHPARARLFELPAGLLDVQGESVLEAAQRELLEEGGVTADNWTHLLTTLPSPGLSSERFIYFLARGVTETPERGGFVAVHEEADMTVAWVPISDLLVGIEEGRLTSGPLVTAVQTYVLAAKNRG